ncbi:DUF2017 family protein [Isoptericola croceus]|uniref:DUF2017 family protein n=1 Tax=Isoptericola croceus TaxID=3031406 RepID=UPI0023F8CDDC|nr:DUF2017 family protein [Isoptericola croceus]
MSPFRATPAGYVARWEPVEREVLARVARDVAGLLRSDAGLPDDVTDTGLAFTGVARVPRDPAVQRLLPDAHRDDADVAAEFRHLTQTDLAASKVARLLAFAETVDGTGDGADGGPDDAFSGGQVLVAREAAQDFAGALTDVRLVLGERLGLDDDADVEHLHHEVLTGLGIVDEADGADPDETDGAGLDAEQRSYWGGVFVAAGFAQESLMDEMLAELRARGARD